MNDKKHLFLYAGTPLDELPGDLRERMESNPKLKDELRSQAEIAALLKLKNYEMPDPAMEGRIQHRIETRIKQFPPQSPARSIGLLPDWARMVAVVVVMFSLSLITHREMMDVSAPESETIEFDARSAAAEAPLPVIELHQPIIAPQRTIAASPPNSTMEPTIWELTPERKLDIESALRDLGLDELLPAQQSAPSPGFFPVSLQSGQ